MTPDPAPADDLLPVHLLELPVPLAAQSRQHFEELLREFTLITVGDGSAPAGTEHHVPSRLLELMAALTQQFAGIGGQAGQLLADAMDRGDTVLTDLALTLPAAVGPATRALGDLLDEADEYCRRGRHLLTLASPPDSVAYRRWYLGQIGQQLAGEAAVSWPAYRAAHPA